MTMAEITYLDGGAELLDRIEELWKELNRHHLERSSHFRDRYESQTFMARKEVMLAKAAGGWIHVWLAWSSEREEPVGYCVGLINRERVGEVESIYVRPEIRNHGIGSELLLRTINWMDQMPVTMKRAEVAWGNQEALGFYARLGLYPRRVVLESKTKPK